MSTDRRLNAALVSIGANVVLVCLKLFGASLSLSMAMKSDAVHSLSDVFVSSLVLFGVLFSQRHTRWFKAVEYVIAFTIACVILGAGLALLLRTLGTMGYASLERIPVAIGVTWVCILISYAVARYKIRIGRECDSPSIEADGYHSMMDMYSSVAVLIGLLGDLTGFRLDTLASIVVVLLVFKIGLEVLIGAIQGLDKTEVSTFETFAFLRRTAVGAQLSVLLGVAKDRPVFKGVAVFIQDLWQRRRAFAGLVVLLAVLVYGTSGIYWIQPDEVGVVLHWGKLAENQAAPGPHYRLPYPVTTLYRVKSNRVRQLEFGFRTLERRESVISDPTTYLWESRHQTGIYQKNEEEAVMLTGDNNEVDVNLIIEYRVADNAAAVFLFELANVEATIRGATESCVRRAVGVMELDTVLTTARQAMEQRIQKDLQDLLDTYSGGIQITTVRLQDVHPPIEVVPAFRSVATARENKVTLINRALGEQKATIPKARGDAEYILADAKAYRIEKTLETQGDTAYFAALTQVFQALPDAVTFLMYMNTVEEVLPMQRKVILDADVRGDMVNSPLQTYFLAGEFLKKGIMTFMYPQDETEQFGR